MSGPGRLTLVSLLTAAVFLGLPEAADAQILKRLKEAATRAAEEEATSQVERMVRSGVACVFDDLDCIRRASDSGQDVYLTDPDGEPVVDDEGNTVSDPGQAAALLGAQPPSARPGEGAWANFDFVPGETVLLHADFADDNAGDFPRRFDLIQGSFEVIEWQGERYLRALSDGSFAIPLPETLPEKFTLETSVSVQHGNGYLRVTPGPAYHHRQRTYTGSAVSVEYAQAGVRPVREGPEALARHEHAVVSGAVVPLRVMADGDHMKVYLGERRVANVPNAVFPRSNTLFVAVGSAAEAHPILMGPVRIAGGGADLYDRLARDGRVATRGILFDVASDVIRPESTPTLTEIATMLQAHPALRIAIEGHTDSDGEDAFNQALSERRAAAVKAYLVRAHGIDASRLEAAGFGESMPVAPNDTPEGKQQNRLEVHTESETRNVLAEELAEEATAAGIDGGTINMLAWALIEALDDVSVIPADVRIKAQLATAFGATQASRGLREARTPERESADYTVYIQSDRFRLEADGFTMHWLPGDATTPPGMWFSDPATGQLSPVSLGEVDEALGDVVQHSGTQIRPSPGEPTREILGHTARAYTYRQTMDVRIPGFGAMAAAAAGGPDVAAVIVVEGTAWIAPDVPEADVVAAFYRNFAGGFGSPQSMLGGQTAGMAALAELGVPLETTEDIATYLIVALPPDAAGEADPELPRRTQIQVLQGRSTSKVTGLSTGPLDDDLFPTGPPPPPECDCSCDAFKALQEMDRNDPNAIARATCARQCMSRWVRCAMP
jgi:OmpA-OmpF porin, OOP family